MLKKQRKMEKNTKKILVFALFGLFVLVFAMQFVAAQSPEDFFRRIGESWIAGGAGAVSQTMAKVFFAILVGIIVFSVGSNIPGFDTIFKNKFLGIAFSAIIAFLAIAYVTPDELYSLMVGYSALGYTLAGVIPLIILAFFTFTLASKNVTSSTEVIGRKTIAAILWVGFSLFSIQRAIVSPSDENWLLLWFFPVAGIFMTIFLGSIWTWISALKTKEVIEVAAIKHKKAIEQIKNLAKGTDELGNPEERS